MAGGGGVGLMEVWGWSYGGVEEEWVLEEEWGVGDGGGEGG